MVFFCNLIRLVVTEKKFKRATQKPQPTTLPIAMINFSRPNSLRFRVIFVHVFTWIMYISFELADVRFVYGRLAPIWTYFVYYTFNLALFYSCVYTLDIKGTRKVFSKFILLPLLLLVYLLLKLVADHYLEFPRISFIKQLSNWHIFLFNSLVRGAYFLILATFYWLAGHLATYRNRAKIAEQQQLLLQSETERRLAEARAAYLQQQINPHLLFNSLNFIYSSVYPHSEDAAKSVLLLADLMRFSLAETDADGKVALSDELKQILNLIEINSYRFSEPLYILAELPKAAGDQRIIPLILLTLTENVFKHGNLLEAAHPAILRVEIHETRLTFYNRNKKKPASSFLRVSRLGLRNTRIRLDHWYGQNYTMDITDSTDFFELTLTLPV
jgi:two-component system LytT family sensor kinase